jgi:ankyrin repeat protein
MSRFGFFSSYSENTTKNTPQTNSDAFLTVRKHSLSTVKKLLDSQSSSKIKEYIDEYGNTLLHVATKAKKLETVKYLLKRGISKYSKNFFEETCWLQAIQTQDQELIQTFIDADTIKLEEYTSKNVKLDNDNKILKDLNETLKTTNDNLTFKYNSLLIETNGLSKENNNFKINNKRLREEVDDLTEKNKKLKISVETLTESLKK